MDIDKAIESIRESADNHHLTATQILEIWNMGRGAWKSKIAREKCEQTCGRCIGATGQLVCSNARYRIF